jgi:hypothetical protein
MSPIEVKDVIIRRLRPGADLLEELQNLTICEKIHLGQISGIGALTRATVGIFLPEQGRYQIEKFEGELEICSLTGNISLEDGRPFVHAHIVLSDKQGHAFGGHLFPGCSIFVAEIIILSFKGAKKERLPQSGFSGLALWPLEEELQKTSSKRALPPPHKRPRKPR